MEFLHGLPDAAQIALGVVLGAGFLGIIFGIVLYKAGNGFESWSHMLGSSKDEFIAKFSDVAELSKRLSKQEQILEALKELPAQIEHLKFVTETAIDVARQHGEEFNAIRKDMGKMESTSLKRIEAIELDVREQLRVLLSKVLELAK